MTPKKLFSLSAGFLLLSGWAAGCGGTSSTDSGAGDADSSVTGGTGEGGATTGGNGTTGGSKATGGSRATGGSTSQSGGSGGTQVIIDCDVPGDSCENGAACCSGLCDAASGQCVQNLGTCSDAGTSCGGPTECCTLNCQGNVCQADACTSDGLSCNSDAQCCGGTCADGSCKDINGSISSCKSSGNACETGAQCCSKLCGESGTCLNSSSYCIQLNDICTSDDQCCHGSCIKGDGATAGYCGKQASTGSGCENKLTAGEVCGGDCSQCCSRSCAPFGATGANICQPASGCRPAGELCRQDEDCCGGDADADLPGAGNGSCDDINSDGVGRCKNNSCTPQGGICKYTEDGYVEFCGGGSTSPNNCCSFLGNNSNCALDGLNIPRCDAIDDCREAGEACATAGDCCGGIPCTQNEAGAFVCYDPPGEQTCVPSAGPCTNNGDCCVGTLCVIQPGSATGSCATTTTGTGGGSGTGGDTGAGGTVGSGGTSACAEYGQQCDMTGDCCNSVPCDQVTHTCRFTLGG